MTTLSKTLKFFVLAILGLHVLTTSAPTQSIYVPYAFTNFAGLPGVSGTNDGIGTAARFNGPTGVALDNFGNIYVTDEGSHTIRRISPAGDVTTVAGKPGEPGSTDGISNAARFNNPNGVTVDSQGYLYIAGYRNLSVRKISPSWEVTTFAGSPDETGSADGTGGAARFTFPLGVALDSNTNLYVTDFSNGTIRKITPEAEVTTPVGIPRQFGTVDGTNNNALFHSPAAIATDSSDNIYVTEALISTLRKIAHTGTNYIVTTLAGSPDQHGSSDGLGNGARFHNPNGVAMDAVGRIYVADTVNDTIRRVTPSGTNWVVTTLGGSPGQQGLADGIGNAARFNWPGGMAVDAMGTLYIADFNNHRITKGTPVLYFDLTASSTGINSGVFHLRLTGQPGTTAIIETSVNGETWLPVRTNLLGLAPLDLSLPLATNQNQFFRARLSA